MRHTQLCRKKVILEVILDTYSYCNLFMQDQTKNKEKSLKTINYSNGKRRVSLPKIQSKYSSLTLTVSWFSSDCQNSNYYRYI